VKSPKRYLVEYDRIRKYIPVPPILKVDSLSITVRRGVGLRCSTRSHPVVKFRLGNMEAKSSDPVYGGVNPLWNGPPVVFPINDIDIEDVEVFSIEVVDKNQLTGLEKVIGNYTSKSSNEVIRTWVANGRFEGDIKLDNGDGFLTVYVKASFPRFLEKWGFRSLRINSTLNGNVVPTMISYQKVNQSSNDNLLNRSVRMYTCII
jgi:ribosomal protein L28